MDTRLFGLWESDPGDAITANQYGTVRLHFFPSGDLTYTIQGADRDEVVRLRYEINGDVITTQQPSKPREEKTSYSIAQDGKLRLTHAGIMSIYRRVGG